MLASCVHPVAILIAVFCTICSLYMFVSDALRDHMVEAYSSTDLVMALYVASMVSLCLPHLVEMRTLSMLIVLSINVCMFNVLDALLMSNATTMVRVGGMGWLKPVATVLLMLCSAVFVECLVLNPCCVGMFGMFCVM